MPRVAAQERIRDKERTKQQLIEAATTLFAERGYEPVSVEAIARRARVNKRLVYYYFGDKLALFASAVGRVYEFTDRQLVLAQPADLRMVVASAVEFFCGHPDVARLLDLDAALHGLTSRARQSALYRAIAAAAAGASRQPVTERVISSVYVASLQITQLDILNARTHRRSHAVRLDLAADFVIQAAT